MEQNTDADALDTARTNLRNRFREAEMAICSLRQDLDPFREASVLLGTAMDIVAVARKVQDKLPIPGFGPDQNPA